MAKNKAVAKKKTVEQRLTEMSSIRSQIITISNLRFVPFKSIQEKKDLIERALEIISSLLEVDEPNVYEAIDSLKLVINKNNRA